jgi:hypothetical protein
MNRESGSLAGLVDEDNQSSFQLKPPDDSRHRHLAAEIASVVGKPESYAGTFASGDSDFELGVRRAQSVR